MEPLISIIIPTIDGREKDFERAVKSAMDQTHQNIEIIPIKNVKNPGEARNIGIKKARGEFIAFLDDDDVWYPEKLEKQLALFDDYTVFVICWIDDRRFGSGYIVRYRRHISPKEVLDGFNLASTSAYMFRSDYLKKEPFDERFPSAQDYDLAIRASRVLSVKCVQEVLVTQYQSDSQITRDWKKKRDGLKRLLKKHKTIYKSYGITIYVNYRIRFIGLHLLYLSAEILGDRIYRIIIPMKRRM